MGKRILLIQGHPDAVGRHFGHALEDAYAEGAATGSHEVRRIAIAQLDFPVLRSQLAWEKGEVPASLAGSQADIAWASHIVLFCHLEKLCSLGCEGD